MTAPHRSTRGRSLPAVLLGLLAVLASLVALPAPAASAASPSLVASAARGAAPAGLRQGRDQLRALPRRGPRQQSGPTAASGERSALGGGGVTPVSGVPATTFVLAALLAVALAAGAAPGHVSRRTPSARRDRAPPALALG